MRGGHATNRVGLTENPSLRFLMSACLAFAATAVSHAASAQGPSNLTKDVGHIAVIEHDGTPFDKDNALARPALARRFFETHGGSYDFLVVFTNFEFDTGDALAFHASARNFVTGIGKPIGVVTGYETTPSRLQGIVTMA